MMWWLLLIAGGGFMLAPGYLNPGEVMINGSSLLGLALITWATIKLLRKENA